VIAIVAILVNVSVVDVRVGRMSVATPRRAAHAGAPREAERATEEEGHRGT